MDSKEEATSSLYPVEKEERRKEMGKGTEVACRFSRSVWDDLPQDVAKRVFALLPVSSVFHCRCVCKKWSLMLSSNNFLNLWGKMSPKTPWFLVYGNSRGVAAFNPISNRWNNIPVYARCSIDFGKVDLVASSGGLLCFRNIHSEYPIFTICNPVTKCKRVLPGLHQFLYCAVFGMVADKSSNSYKILATGTTNSPNSPHSNCITEVYDSLTGCWVRHCNSEQDFMKFSCEVRAVWCRGSFYCLSAPFSSTQGYRVMAYNMLQKDWCDLNVQMPSEDLDYPSLLACQGRLLLAATVFIDISIERVFVWELDWGTLKWREIDSMVTSTILRGLDVPHRVVLECYGNTDLICFGEDFMPHSAIYDLSQKTWYCMPHNIPCQELKASDATLDHDNYPHGISFEPNLLANV